ncbi:hypothetical protein Hypma_006289 [Hypsizygus marmoreus]|uniref:Uncharacterized protein n=1 Tax=Hypsizygus marmoreus TaxID=39966 RepID=A0A369JYB7_HYPMA|nr:hypothetical protein Hypma_006289 [Hypsizygus marmoreus]
MRFTSALVVLVAATFSGAAIIPRANVDMGLEARYYRGEKYARAILEAVKPTIVNRRVHPRDFLTKRTAV